MPLPGQAGPGSSALGSPALRLARTQGGAASQTPQVLGGSAQQAPAAQGGAAVQMPQSSVAVLQPPQGQAMPQTPAGQQNQGNGALPGQQNQGGPAALQTQQGGQTQQGQQAGGSAGLLVLPNVVLPDDAADPYSAYQQYEQMLGGEMPAGGYAEFLRIRNAKGKEWTNLRVKYWKEAALKQILDRTPDFVSFKKPKDILQEYMEAANVLEKAKQFALYHYSCYEEGKKMNMFLGSVPGITLTNQEQQNLKNVSEALARMCLPYDTVLWRGTKRKLLKGLERLDPNDLDSWINETVSMDGYCSTSILSTSAYDAEVHMIILAPKGVYGAGYINEISYNKAHEGMTSGSMTLQQEYEVLLQKGSKFAILQVEIADGKLVLVVNWIGGKHD